MDDNIYTSYTREETAAALVKFDDMVEQHGGDGTIAGEVLWAVDNLLSAYYTNGATVGKGDNQGEVNTCDRFFKWLGHKYLTGNGLPKDWWAGLEMCNYCEYLEFFAESEYYEDCLNVGVAEIVDFLEAHPELAATTCPVSYQEFWEPQDEPEEISFSQLEKMFYTKYGVIE